MENADRTGGPGNSEFIQTFRTLTGGKYNPYPWQSSLAAEPNCRSMTIRIPTGLGKTEGVIAAWMWHRLLRNADADCWPRRLVWCLPMRVLVEQTFDIANPHYS